MSVTARLVVAALVTAAAFRSSASQILVPPAASLDVHVTAAPIPVRIGGRVHLVYELHVTNFRAIDLALTRIEILDDDRDRTPLASYQDSALRASLARAGMPRSTADPQLVASGMRAVMFVWLPLTEGAPVPRALRHRISFDLLAGGSRDAGSITTQSIAVRAEAPIALDPPLRGGPWAAIYDPSSAGGHRRAVFAIDGRARIPARFAVDWVKLTDDTHGYGADVLAVADATVVAAVDRYAEPTVPITLDNAAGNYVAIDLGAGAYAFYEHLRPGSIRVKPGEGVKTGQVLAALGASGSVSSGAHLHFHVSDANSSLGAEGLPYVFRRFEVLGAFRSLDAFAKGEAWVPASGERRMELPDGQTVVRF
jgi:murein DD-endopeptidase